MKKSTLSIKMKSSPCKNVNIVSTPPKKKRVDALKAVCWIIIPVIVVALLLLDALGIYTFNTERLIVFGVGLLVVLLPFFSEITVKNLSLKRNQTKDKIA